ncbi:MAG: aldose 1-epimerase family protein [Candidatus Ornithomonoglobus sp.]
MELNNGIIKISIADHGAELKSVIKNGREYMWCGDAKYWGRTSPVLFPFVGSMNGKKFKLNGKDFPMSQHGFARDCDFEPVGHTENSVEYVLISNDETLAKYPFKFRLNIKYTISGSTVKVKWTVSNTDNKAMSFSIGAHPAFNLMNGQNYFKFDTDNDIVYRLVNENGLLVADKSYSLKTTEGYAPIVKGMFDLDALIIENSQANAVSLCGSDKKPYVTVKFTAPLFGLWSPAGKDAPFICIEPWYGRADKADFSGDLFDREYASKLEPGESFSASYEIEFI